MADPNYPLQPIVHVSPGNAAVSPAPTTYPGGSGIGGSGTEPPAAWVNATAEEAARLSGATRDHGVSGTADPWLSASVTVWSMITGHVRTLPPSRIDGSPPGDLAAVARSATVRYGTNPTQARSVSQVGVSSGGAPFGIGEGTLSAVFLGFLLHELVVINRYRQTWR
jgi:hypothetical protein